MGGVDNAIVAAPSLIPAVTPTESSDAEYQLKLPRGCHCMMPTIGLVVMIQLKLFATLKSRGKCFKKEAK